MKKTLSLALVSTFLLTNVSFAATNYNYNSANQTQHYNSNQPLKGYLVSVPAGMVVPVVTTQELASNTLTQGQLIQMALGSDFYYDN